MKLKTSNASDEPVRFPILGGRLLKILVYDKINKNVIVSNPWREAIEEQNEHII